MCLYPRIGINKKYTITEKNGGNVPPLKDVRLKYVPWKCGRCQECMQQRKREWQTRLYEEIKTNKNAKLVTLTFSDEKLIEISNKIKGLTGYELENEIATVALRAFMERWRKKHSVWLKHWCVTELGHQGTERIHMHGILWIPENIKNWQQEVQDKWQYGWVWTGKKTTRGEQNYVNMKSINYIIKYLTKVDEKHKEYKSIILSSKGIGSEYIKSSKAKDNVYKGDKTNSTYTTKEGNKIKLNTYWYRSIYSEKEREEMWLNLLDKNIRYVGGQEIDISKGEEEYYKVLEYYQAKSQRAGYGTGEINWERKQYENERRKAKLNEIKEKVNGIASAKDWGDPQTVAQPMSSSNAEW